MSMATTLSGADSKRLRGEYILRLARTGTGWWSASADEREEARFERCLMLARGETVGKIPLSPAELAAAIEDIDEMPTPPIDENADDTQPASKSCERCGQTKRSADGGLTAINCGCWRYKR